MKKIMLLMTIIAAVFLTGCATRRGHFSVVSLNSMDLNLNRSSHRVDTTVKLKGKHQNEYIIVFPTGTASIEKAISKAVKNYPEAVGLANVSVRYCYWYLFPLYGERWYEIEGNPIYER